MSDDAELLDGFRDAAHRRRNRMLLLILMSVIVGATLGAVTVVPLQHHFHEQHKPLPWWVLALVAVGEVLFFLVEFGVIMLIHRRRHGTWLPEPARVAGADRRTRKRVAKAFRRGRLPQDRTERALTVDLADKVMRVRKLVIPLAVLAVLELVLLFVDPKPVAKIGLGLTAFALGGSAAMYGFLVHRGKQIKQAARPKT